MPCQTFSEFVDNPYYLGIKQDVWKEVKSEGDRIWNRIMSGKITEANLLWGIGSGKSFIASIIGLMFVHYLLCLKNPHRHYNLASDKAIVVVNMGTTATQAKNVIFASNRKFVETSPFFKEHSPEILQTEIKFTKKNISLYCGNSKETMPIGMNVIMGVLDEAAWYLDTENKSAAENIYNVIKNRIVSRFGDRGFVLIISAPRYVDDFMTRHYEKSQSIDYVYTSMKRTWETKDKIEGAKTFDFIVSSSKEGKPVEVWKDIPVSFKKSSERNPEKFMRDFGVRPSLVLEAFDKDSNIIVREATNRENPINEYGELKRWFKSKDNIQRFIHIDLGLKKDACGIAMGHQKGTVNIEGEELPNVYIDLVLQIKPKPGEEIKFSEIRQLIYSLQERGFNIVKVSLDQYQSVDTIQILKEKGINAEILSVDRDAKAYETLKEALHQHRFDCYSYPPLHKEYQRLELVKGKKIDHSPGGSKDVSDAIAGVCFHIANDKKNSEGFLNYIKNDKESQEDISNKFYKMYKQRS